MAYPARAPAAVPLAALAATAILTLLATACDERPPTAPAEAPAPGPPAFTVETLPAGKLLASDGSGGELFGFDVSVSGDFALLGAIGDQDHGASSGSAYIFRRLGSGWLESVKLLPDDGAAGDAFGWSVASDGDVALVGSPGDDDNGSGAGAVYVFRRIGGLWEQEAKLLADDGSAGDNFGYLVGISGDVVLVGAPLDDTNANLAGAAYVFRRVGGTWAQEAKLLPNDFAPSDWFGESGAISGDVVLLGARDDDNGAEAGAVYVFRRIGGVWEQEAKLLPDDGAADDRFGSSISMSGDVALVGAFRDDDNGANSGAAYVFRAVGSVWAQEEELLPDDGTEDDGFGFSLQILGDIALVGAPGASRAYVFRRVGSDWQLEIELLKDDGDVFDHFATSVALGGDIALVGAARDDDSGKDSGSAHIFGLAPQAPAERVESLVEAIADLGASGTIDSRQASALSGKLETALEKIEEGNVSAAIGTLEAFINQVEAQAGKKIPADLAAALIAAVEEIIAQLDGDAG